MVARVFPARSRSQWSTVAVLAFALAGCRNVLGVQDLETEDGGVDASQEGRWDGGLGKLDSSSGGTGGAPDGAGAGPDAGPSPDGSAPDAAPLCPPADAAAGRVAPIEANRIGGPGDDVPQAMARIGDGVIVVFNYAGLIEVGDSVHNSFTMAPPNDRFSSQDVMVVRLDRENRPVWSESLGGRGRDFGFGVTVAPDGAIYVAGTFERDASFDNKIVTSRGGEDGFLAKLDPDEGSVVWVKSFGDAGDDAVLAVAATNQGVVATGTFAGQETFGLAQALTAKGERDAFLASYDRDGKVVFARALPAIDSMGTAVRLTPDGSIVLGGIYRGAIDLGWGSIAVPNDDELNSSVFLARYDAGGRTTGGFGKVFGGPKMDFLAGLVLDDEGNIYLGGSFQGAANFGGSTLSSTGEFDAYLASYTSTGTHRFSMRAGGGSTDLTDSVARGPGNTILWSGVFVERAIFPNGIVATGREEQGFVAVVAPCSGALTHFYDFGGDGYDEALAVSADGRGGITVATTFEKTVTFADGLSRTSVGLGDVAIVHIPAP